MCPGRGAHRIFPPRARHTGVAVACPGAAEREFGGLAHYRLREWARLVAGRGERRTLSAATGQRMLAAVGLNPPRLRDCLTRPDPRFEAQRAAILERSWPPPRRWRSLCLDEKPPRHALERLSPTRPLRPGLMERQECAYGRHGTVDLFAAFAVGTGEVFAQCSQRHTNLELRHCWRALRARDPDSRWPLSGDTAGYHTQHAVLDWGAAHRPTVTLHWWPPPGAWLTHVEMWFSLLSRHCLRRASVRSTQALRTLLPRFLTPWNTPFAPPLAWTYTGTPLAVAPQH
jgi:hypothetical protein